MSEKPYDTPIIGESLALDIVSGRMTMKQAAEELSRYNHTPYVDLNWTKQMLAPYIAKINAKEGSAG